MNYELINLFNCNDFDEAISCLKEELKFQSQKNYYDFIFNTYLTNKKSDISLVIIKGLSRLVKIAILTAYYKKIIYNLDEENSTNVNNKLI